MIDLYRIGIIIVTVTPLLSCDEFSKKKSVLKDNSIEFNKFISDIKDELIYMKGGDFLMGDYGEQYGPERLPYDAKEHSKPLHKVELTGYSISKFKTSNKEYQYYLSYNHLEGRNIDLNSRKGKHWRERNIAPETPAHVDWYEAEKYCHWLGTVTDLPLALPTESQWEYDSRSRGEFVIAPTNDGAIQI